VRIGTQIFILRAQTKCKFINLLILRTDLLGNSRPESDEETPANVYAIIKLLLQLKP